MLLRCQFDESERAWFAKYASNVKILFFLIKINVCMCFFFVKFDAWNYLNGISTIATTRIELD